MSEKASHNTFVWQEGHRRWYWRCTCGSRASEPFGRRSDADEATEDHMREHRFGPGAAS